jgi:hypothetical protein
MNDFSVRRRALLVGGLAAATLAAACEDKRIKELHSGMTRDSVVTVIARDAKPGLSQDSFPNTYTREQYLLNGKNYDVLYFTPDNDKAKVLPFGQKPIKAADSIPFKKLTPLVFIDNRLAGRGWAFWDSVSTSLKIPLKPR